MDGAVDAEVRCLIRPRCHAVAARHRPQLSATFDASETLPAAVNPATCIVRVPPPTRNDNARIGRKRLASDAWSNAVMLSYDCKVSKTLIERSTMACIRLADVFDNASTSSRSRARTAAEILSWIVVRTLEWTTK